MTKLNMKLAMAAVLAGLSSAAQYRWIHDNDLANPNNYQAGVVPSGNINLNKPCMERGGGQELSISVSMSVGSIDLPMNGDILLGANVDIEFTGSTANSGDLRCRDSNEYQSDCSSNWQVLNTTVNEFQPATSIPCIEDIAMLNGDVANAIHWSAGMMIAQLQISGNTPAQISTAAAFEQYRSTVSGQMTGTSPHIGGSTTICGGTASCLTMCADSCNAFSIDNVAANAEAFYNLSVSERDEILTEGQNELDNLIDVRQNIIPAFSNTAQLGGALSQMQNDFVDGIDPASISDSLGSGQIPMLKVTSDEMADWMEASSVGSMTALFGLKNMITVSEAQQTWNWFGESGRSLDSQLWALINDESSLTTEAASTVPSARRQARQSIPPVPPGASSALQQVNDFIFMEINRMLAQYNIAAGENWQIITTVWGGATAVDVTNNFPNADGAFQWNGLTVSGVRLYTDADGNRHPLVNPEILKALLSSAMSRMSMYVRESYLREILFNIPTTTQAVLASTGDDDSSSMMLYIIIAAVAALLLIVILAFILMRDSGNQDDSAPRQVVSFENPMYDDPANAGGSGVVGDDDPGLYDEPAFQANNRDNPTYESNENLTDPGYLDVNPDDEYDEDDEDDE